MRKRVKREARNRKDETRSPPPAAVEDAEDLFVVRLLAEGMPHNELVHVLQERLNVTRPLARERLARVLEDLVAVDQGMFDRSRRKVLLRHWLEAGLLRETNASKAHVVEEVEEVVVEERVTRTVRRRSATPTERARHAKVALQYAQTMIDLDGLAEPRRVHVSGQVTHAHLHARVRDALRAKRERQALDVPKE